LKERELKDKEKLTNKSQDAKEIIPASSEQDKSPTTITRNPTSFKWATFTLPTTIGKLTSLFGNYSKFIPCDDPCDGGSTYEWKISNGLIINAWAMSVGPQDKASKQHQVEAYDLTAKNNAVIDNVTFGLSLNSTTLTECKQKFNLKKSNFDNAWKFKQNGLFTYLWFNPSGTLIKIGQFPFDYDSVN
jgi:hypothetical protein